MKKVQIYDTADKIYAFAKYPQKSRTYFMMARDNGAQFSRSLVCFQGVSTVGPV